MDELGPLTSLTDIKASASLVKRTRWPDIVDPINWTGSYVKFSDSLYGLNAAPGKLKRMWFLVQLLKAAGVNKEAGDMTVCINAVAGQMIVEYPQMLR